MAESTYMWEMNSDVLEADLAEFLAASADLWSGRKLILVGHSMGGAVVSKLAKHTEDGMFPELKEAIAGVVVLDVVEGTAIEAVPAMTNIIRSRPSEFSSVAEAIR